MFSAKESSSSVENVRHSLERIKANDIPINAFVNLRAKDALREAAAIDRLPGGAAGALLTGRTVAVKDCIAVAGSPCTMGSAFYRRYVPATDAAIIPRLKAAGGVVIGKTNMHEFAFGGTTENPHFGACRNPWNLTCIPGGSSGGSAAAIAAGFCDLALGTDTGSSIRMPAALCGITGLRPTRDLVPGHGCLPVSSYLDVIGPMGRTIRDVAALLTALTGGKDEDSQYLRAVVDADLTGLRIGILESGYLDQCDAPVAAAVEEAILQFEAKGAELFPIALPEALTCRDHVTTVIYRDAAEFHRERITKAPMLFGAATLARLQPGLDINEAVYQFSCRKLREWEGRIARVFSEVCDLVLTPTVPLTAPPIGADGSLASRTDRLAHCCWPWAGARVPALTLPCGFDKGLPIGLQLAAAKYDEVNLLRAGAAYQATTEWHLQRADIPVVPIDPLM